MRSKRGRSVTVSRSRRDFLRYGGLTVGAAIVAPSWPRLAAAQSTTTTFDYYISTTGSDGNPGTLAEPWALTSMVPGNANQSKMAGKRVGLLPGTYDISNTSLFPAPSPSGSYTESVLEPPAGTAASPTYIGSSDSSGNYSARTATITYGTAGAQVAGFMGPTYNSGGYVTIDGLVFNANGLINNHVVQAYFPPEGYTSQAGNGPGIVIQNCEIYGVAANVGGQNQALIFLEGANGAIVQNNYLHDVSQPDNDDHVYAIVQYSCQNTQILYNTFYNCCGTMEGKGGCSGCNIAYNYLFSQRTDNFMTITGFDGAPGNPNTPGTANSIHHNVIELDESPQGGICPDMNTNFISQGFNCYNNTVYDRRSNPRWALMCRGMNSASYVSCYNNIVVTTVGNSPSGTSYPGIVCSGSVGFNVFNYNCYQFASFFAAVDTTQYQSMSSWQAASHADANSLTVNPQFAQTIQAGAGPAQFQLASGSPCIGAGRIGGASSGAACNMGAWDGTVTQIGCSFAPNSASGSATPSAPVLSVG